jgi:hypothetical protein
LGNAQSHGVQHSVFAGIRAAGETRTQEHDEGNIKADEKRNRKVECGLGRHVVFQIAIQPCLVVGGSMSEIRIHVVDAIGVSSRNPELGRAGATASCQIDVLQGRKSASVQFAPTKHMPVNQL